MKKLLFLLLFSLHMPVSGYSQANTTSEKGVLLEEIPQEKIFLHYNATLLFAGEYLYYKLYNLDAETGNFSQISKVAYVELVGKDGKSVFKHKILLENSQGQGDFFLPTTVPSGNYKLLAYTNWMRNKNAFFAGDLAIINPYRGDQSAITANASEEASNPVSSERIGLSQKNSSKVNDDNMKMTLQKDTFGSRQKVMIDFEGVSGNYSLSARVKDSIDIPQSFNSRNFIVSNHTEPLNRDSVFLPEVRGDLFSGRIVPDPKDSNQEKSGKKIAFSIPGEDFIFKIATTDKQGRFYLNLDDHYLADQALMQVISEGFNEFTIQPDPLPQIDVKTFTFGNFEITPKMKNWILDRSVQNQIENAYYSVKPDTLKSLQEIVPFYTKEPMVYDLDAYTRFPTIKETFVEIIKFSYISKARNGKSRIIVRQPQGATNYDIPTLLLVDGVMVQDHEQFINYPAKNVKSINILRDNIFLGSHIFSGLVDVRTIEGNYAEVIDKTNIEVVTLKPAESKKSYFKQTYKDEAKNLFQRIPDLRTQLFWQPSLDFQTSRQSLEFYTSDVPGVVEIRLEGFTHQGKPVSVTREILVKP